MYVYIKHTKVFGGVDYKTMAMTLLAVNVCRVSEALFASVKVLVLRHFNRTLATDFKLKVASKGTQNCFY